MVVRGACDDGRAADGDADDAIRVRLAFELRGDALGGVPLEQEPLEGAGGASQKEPV